MKIHRPISLLCLVLLFTILTGIASAFVTPESIVAAGQVYISNVTQDPEVFFTGDSGVITFEVANGASEQGIVVNHASLSGENIRTTSRPYDTSANIGPARYSASGNIPQTKTFTFSVYADAPEGTYYPTFSLSFRDADSLYYRPVVKVDNTPLVLSILDKPDAFTQNKKRTIYLQVANPRKNIVRSAALEVSGDGISAMPNGVFIGDIAAGEKAPVNITITPEKATTAQLVLTYKNGDNPHNVSMTLPITFGIDKKQANPVMSNVQVKSDAGVYHVTGDVNNAGLETANTVMVTVLSPAVPQDPYKTYVVGALKPDDFGSFEVTFSAEPKTSSVPVQLSYKDTDGNIYTTVQDVKISSSPGLSTVSGEKGSSSNMLPVAAAIVLVLIFVGGWIYYLRRNKK
ncbi:MAG: hypothetical protein LUQ19_03730 [Methanoregula sp.]|nr:hypothetical protein [Methanoregula sp.]